MLLNLCTDPKLIPFTLTVHLGMIPFFDIIKVSQKLVLFFCRTPVTKIIINQSALNLTVLIHPNTITPDFLLFNQNWGQFKVSISRFLSNDHEKAKPFYFIFAFLGG